MKMIIWFTTNEASASNSKMIAGIKRFAAQHDWQIQVLPKPRSDAAMRAELAFWQPDGVVADASYTPEVFGGLPVVIMSSRPKGYRGKAVFIEHDAVRTTAAAAEELFSLEYRSFAFVGALGEQSWSDEREDAFRKILRRRGCTCLSCPSPRTDRTDPLRFQKRLRGFLAALPKPCALLAAHDQVGQYVLYAANALGLAIPHDLAICSIDNDEGICLTTTPTLTSVLIGFEEAGRMAGETFAALFSGIAPERLGRTYGPMTTIRRGSTADLIRRDALVVRAREFIRREVTRGVSAQDVAALFPCSPRMAQLRFRRATGHSIIVEILDARTKEAERLMLSSELSFDAIAQLSGWRSLRNFHHHLRKVTGCTPGQWKERFAR